MTRRTDAARVGEAVGGTGSLRGSGDSESGPAGAQPLEASTASLESGWSHPVGRTK